MSGSMYQGEQTIVAVYDTPAHAELAVQDLLAANVPASAVERHNEQGSFGHGATTEPVRKGGFLANLFGNDTHEDAGTYTDSMSRGGTVVTVHGIPHRDFESVAAILEAHRPIEFNETGGTPVTATAPASLGTSTGVAGGDKLQLSEESLVVGKRLVNRGGTRIRRYVVETPVEEQVVLHGERVIVDRHPVTDGRAVDAAAFSDNEKVIELTETDEEVVVGKTARVVEEIALRKEGVDRTEIVHDTVRKEEVEIEQVPGEVSSTGVVDPTIRRT